MNKKMGAFTAFMMIFSAILMHYFALYNRPKIQIGRADETRCVYLTFDDGPSDRVTPCILDTLKDEGVKATFFIVGKSAKGREGIVRRAFDEGHAIGVHSFSHEYSKIYGSPAALAEDMERCNDVIESITGKRSGLYRFPGGSYGRAEGLTAAVRAAGYEFFDWNASCMDAELPHPDPASLADAAKTTAAGKRQVILLCHDSTDKIATAAALKDIIRHFRGGGYTFDTLENFCARTGT